MKYKYVLFDLDGTLTDPAEGITNSVAYALKKSGIEPPEREKLYKFIGPPLVGAFMQFYGFTEEQARAALGYYRENYVPRGIYELFVYPGIRELLSSLRASGHILAVATSKPEAFARQILERVELAEFFEFIGGSTMDETRVEKSDVVAYVLENLHVSDKKSAVMVGDREHDVIGAAKNGLDCIGVLFGYGSREELQNAGAKHLASDAAEIKKYV